MKTEDSSNEQFEVLGTLFMGISTAKILDFLLAYREFDYSETEIATNAGVSLRHLYRALPTLVNAGLVYLTEREGRKKKYRLDKNSKAVYHLERMVYSLIDQKSKMSTAQPTLLEHEEMIETPKIS